MASQYFFEIWCVFRCRFNSFWHMKRYWRWLIPKALGIIFLKHPLGQGFEKNMPEKIHLQKKVFLNLALCYKLIMIKMHSAKFTKHFFL